jgi:DNA-binding LacI/PurR family transcriptional regulator
MKSHRISKKLHNQVAEQLIEHIRLNCKAGDRLDPIRDLARDLEVSWNTIRAAQALLVQEGFLVVRHGSGTYTTARSVTRHVGIYTEADITHPQASAFGLRVIHSLRQFSRARGFTTTVYTGEGEPWNFSGEPTCVDFLDDVMNRRLDGVLSLSPPHAKWMQKLQADGIPIVGGTSHYPYAVLYDHAAVLQSGARQLLESGRQRLALMSWDQRSAPGIFRSILKKAGIPVREKWIRSGVHPSLHGSGWEEFREIWMAYPEKPDGLLVVDDVLFQDALPAILGSGVRIPDDLMIVAHANKGSGMHYPFPLTLMQHDQVAMANAMGDMLVRLMHRQPIAQPQISLPFEWVDVKGSDRLIHLEKRIPAKRGSKET